MCPKNKKKLRNIKCVYSNCCWSCWFEHEIIKICQSSHKMYSNNIVNFQVSTTILNAHTKKVWKLIVCTSYISTVYANNLPRLHTSNVDRSNKNGFTLKIFLKKQETDGIPQKLWDADESAFCKYTYPSRIPAALLGAGSRRYWPPCEPKQNGVHVF